MISILSMARQPVRESWSLDKLIRTRAIALGHAIVRSTAVSYSSHLQPYIMFCKTHITLPSNLRLIRFPATLYLCAITSNPTLLIPISLESAMSCSASLTNRHNPLDVDHINAALAHFPPTSHNNRLFRIMLLSEFFALHRLGELT